MPKSHRRYKSQPRLGVGIRRLPGHHSLMKSLNDKLQHEADLTGVSKSWITATILAEYFNVKEQADYRKI